MPAPDYKFESPIPVAFRKIMDTNDSILTSEIQALREEIVALRAELKPNTSVILIGREALDEFKRLCR